jgi:phage recombination protein Bet
MSNELIKAETPNLETLTALRKSLAPDLTDSEFNLFAQIVAATGLNPILKEIWAIKAAGRLQIMTGINGFLRIANSHPQFDGIECTQVWDKSKLVAVECKVYRKDRKFPAVAIAYLSEYGKSTPIWRQMPSIMLSKCAKSLALREAFVQQLGALYTVEEMPAEYAPRYVETPPKPARVAVEESTVHYFKEGEAVEAPKEGTTEEVEPAPVFYTLEACPRDKLEAAQKYLEEQGCKRISQFYWRSETKLDRLSQFIDHDFRN